MIDTTLTLTISVLLLAAPSLTETERTLVWREGSGLLLTYWRVVRSCSTASSDVSAGEMVKVLLVVV